jgi:TolB protein
MIKGIAVYDLSTGEEKLIATIGEYPVWSPDSKRLAFHWPEKSSFSVYTVNADGSDLKQLTKTGNGSAELPSWSFDGKKIYFQTNRRQGNWEIWTMDTDGKDQKPLIWN